MTCPNGHPVPPDSRTCPMCGAAVVPTPPQWSVPPQQPQQQQPQPPQPPVWTPAPTQPVSTVAPPAPPVASTPPPVGPYGGPPAPPGSNGGGRSTPLWIALVAVSVLAAVAATIAVVSLTDDDSTDTATDSGATTTLPAPTTAPPATDPQPTPAPPTPAPTPAPPVTMAPVGSLPAGKFCRDLQAAGYSYSAAVDYWKLHGQTNDMDVDRNGVPCETVYPRSDVVSYWGDNGGLPAPRSEVVPLGSALLCADLQRLGISVYGAFEYYIDHGFPKRMDADGDGIPCETVYPGAEEAWYNY